MKIKNLGQVFTPLSIVKYVLDAAGYKGPSILNKHVIDNSCGTGNFLTEIIDRYASEYSHKYNTLENIENDLGKYIHGIEVDPDIFAECKQKLFLKTKELKIKEVNLDLINGNALSIKKFNGKMDFVLGNPPYVRVHNLNEQYENAKKFSFCKSGMTDLYIGFYEIGMNMLKSGGVLCYITPNSFYNSLAGKTLRKHIEETRSMELLIDFGHYQAFSVTAYTTICKIIKEKNFDFCKYYKFDVDSNSPKFISNINYKNLFIDDNIILSTEKSSLFDCLNYKVSKKPRVVVKNGFATLNDKVFIKDDFPFSENVIDVIKASTGKWEKCVFPYDKNGVLIPIDKLAKETKKYFLDNKDNLIKGDKKLDSSWYAFGRSQAIKDVKYKKLSLNNCIKDFDSIKLNTVDENQGVYSGFYILTDEPYEKIEEALVSPFFIEYLKALDKCKRGGYFTFSSKDLSKYLNYRMEE